MDSNTARTPLPTSSRPWWAFRVAHTTCSVFPHIFAQWPVSPEVLQMWCHVCFFKSHPQTLTCSISIPGFTNQETSKFQIVTCTVEDGCWHGLAKKTTFRQALLAILSTSVDKVWAFTTHPYNTLSITTDKTWSMEWISSVVVSAHRCWTRVIGGNDVTW